MKLSLKWLSEYADISQIDINTLADKLTRHTAEVEEIEETSFGTFLDIDNKTLTHRPDLFSHVGFGREIKALFDVTATDPLATIDLVPTDNTVPVEIQTPLCTRFSCAKVTNVEITNSNKELQDILQYLGAKPINTYVDITNEVNFRFAQPMHAFDADKIQGTIVVRMAINDEKIQGLDGENYILSADDIVIADDSGAISIAGIMGGMSTSITTETTNILFEAAHFDPIQVRRTANRLGIRTEASLRFEKALNPDYVTKALCYALEITKQRDPKANIPTHITDQYPNPVEHLPISISPERLRTVSGIAIADADIITTLESVGFTALNTDADIWQIKVPSWRATKDVTDPADVYEEVMRLYGFEHITSTLPLFPITPPQENTVRKQEHTLRQACATLGYNEYMGYDFAPEGRPETTGLPDYITVENPLSSEQKYLRQTCITSIIERAESELRTHGDIALFELGHIYPSTGEETQLCIVKSCPKSTVNLTHELKQHVETILRQCGLTVEFKATKPPHNLFHPHICGEIVTNTGHSLGVLGAMHPKYLPHKGTNIIFAELNSTNITQAIQEQSSKYSAPSNYPTSVRDISITIAEKTYSADIIAAITQCSPLITKVELFDTFVDAEKIGVGMKNYSYRIQFQSTEETLQQEQIDDIYNAIITQLHHAFDATIRT